MQRFGFARSRPDDGGGDAAGAYGSAALRSGLVLVRKRSKALGLLGSDWKKRRIALYGRGNALAPRNVLLVLSEPASDEVTEEFELDAAVARRGGARSAGTCRRGAEPAPPARRRRRRRRGALVFGRALRRGARRRVARDDRGRGAIGWRGRRAARDAASSAPDAPQVAGAADSMRVRSCSPRRAASPAAFARGAPPPLPPRRRSRSTAARARAADVRRRPPPAAAKTAAASRARRRRPWGARAAAAAAAGRRGGWWRGGALPRAAGGAGPAADDAVYALSADEAASRGALRQCDVDGDGFVEAAEGAALLTRSGLPKPQLKHAWALADADGDGRRARRIVVAMHLVKLAAKRGVPLPAALRRASPRIAPGGGRARPPRPPPRRPCRRAGAAPPSTRPPRRARGRSRAAARRRGARAAATRAAA